MARRKRADWFGFGALLQLCGLICILAVPFFPLSTAAGVALIIWGGLVARKMKCSECGAAVSRQQALCDICHSQLK